MKYFDYTYENYPSTRLRASYSDKIKPESAYGDFYDIAVASLLTFHNQPLRILELGVSRFGKGSGHAFCELPYVETVVGVDTVDLGTPFGEKGVFIKGDAYTDEIVVSVSKYAPFDLIIDDCVHLPPNQKIMFEKYYPLLNIPGIMTSEDISDEKLADCKRVINRDDLHVVCTPGTGGVANLLVIFNITEPQEPQWGCDYKGFLQNQLKDLQTRESRTNFEQQLRDAISIILNDEVKTPIEISSFVFGYFEKLCTVHRWYISNYDTDKEIYFKPLSSVCAGTENLKDYQKILECRGSIEKKCQDILSSGAENK